MTVQASDGPFTVLGQRAPLVGTAGYTGAQPALLDSNPDLAPSLVWGGMGIRDPRWRTNIGGGSLGAGGYANQDVGWLMANGGMIGCDQAPATLNAANIAAAQAATSGTALTLAAASTGITVLASALSLFVPLGATIPAGALVLDANPGYVGSGTSGAFKFFDPTKGVARAVSVTANGGATGGVIRIVGYDIYGAALVENITAVASNTVDGKKAFKFIVSATPAFTDGTHTYSVGTTDIIGFNTYAAAFPYVRVFVDSTMMTANTGFVAGVTTTPATAVTGDVRGTYALQTAADGTKKLYMFASPSVNAIAASTFALAQAGLIGVPQYGG